MSFDPNEYKFEDVKQKIFELAKEYSQDLDLTPVLNVDMKVQLEDLTCDFIESLSLLEPCGAGNSNPVFSIENLQLNEQKMIGQKQNHLKFICSDAKNNMSECVYWNHPVFELKFYT